MLHLRSKYTSTESRKHASKFVEPRLWSLKILQAPSPAMDTEMQMPRV